MRRSDDIERLYDEHASSLFAFLLNFTRNESETRDLLQEIFVKIAREPDLFHNVRNERAYLIRLARNLAVDSIRRRDSRERASENVAMEEASVFAPAADPDEELFRNELTIALKDLPEEQGIVAYLKLWEGLTFEEIADILDISPNTAASRYRYALDKLRERLRPLYKEITNAGQ
jgi:RNA polymerase sigma-70 factor (ECF subfamily)